MNSFRDGIQRLIPKLRQYAFALTRDRTQADDLVQACLAKALEKEALWMPGSDLRAWLFTIMHNEFVTLVRRNACSPVVTLEGAGLRQTNGLLKQEDRLRVRDFGRALATLPEDYREVVLLIAWENRSYDAVATQLGVPIGTVKSRLSRAREMLRDLMDTGRAGRTVLAKAA
jgi:RNA polymerase sigma-70 factor (ECF subfamily)